MEALGSRQCSPATAALLHRSRITELSPKNSRTLRRILIDEIRALPKQNADVTPPDKLKVLRQYNRRHLAANSEVTPPDGLKVPGSTLGDN